MRKIVLVASALAGTLLLSRSSGDTIPYAVTGKTGEIEFRQYPALVLATADN